jgi:hypothetical protein
MFCKLLHAHCACAQFGVAIDGVVLLLSFYKILLLVICLCIDTCRAGLPDGLISNQKSQFGKKISGSQIGKC